MDRITVSIRRWLPLARTIAALLLVVAACWVAWQPLTSPQVGAVTRTNLPATTLPSRNSPSLPKGPLPGSQIWNDGASSFLFGTNDGYEWSERNIQTQPAIQVALRDAGFTLLRTFIPDNASDAVLDQRIGTVENIGAKCLAVLTNIENTTFNQHVVSYFGSRCQLYEFGNEPDYELVPFQHYMSAWNETIPLLRKINPSAKFIGPAVINSHGFYNYLPQFLKGVKASGVIPDAISIHYYPCWHMDEATCLASAATYTSTAQEVRRLIKNALGRDLPIGMSEWNYDPRNPPPPYGDKAEFISKFSAAAIKAMIAGGVAFACQFDAASYAGYGRLDMFDVNTGLAKPQYYALKDLIKHYKPVAASRGVNAATLGPTLLTKDADVICSANDSGPEEPSALLDGKFGNWGFWQLTPDTMPGSCAIHLKQKANSVTLAWFSDYSFDFIDPTSMAPLDYDITVSANSTDGSDGTWKTVASVRGNHARAREHTFSFAGMSWIRMTVLAGQPQASQPFMRIDEIQVFDTQNLGSHTFYFSGDSITGMSYNRFADNLPSFADDMAKCAPGHYPLMIDGGFGGQTLDAAVQGMATWQELAPDVHYWLLGWGTNDALNLKSPEVFKTQLQTVVTAIVQHGGVPIVAHIPYAAYHGGPPNLDNDIQALNRVIDEVTAANHLIPGPDLYGLIKAHPQQYLGPDGLHPSGAGAVAINAEWFKALRAELGLAGASCN